MPDEALAEALEGLAETYKYWTVYAPALSESNAPASVIRNAIAGPSYTRQTFRATEE